MKSFVQMGVSKSIDALEDSNGLTDETSERRLYIGNLDQRITDQNLISKFEVSTQEAQLAKQKMNGRLACGRPLVSRYASEKYYLEMSSTSPKASNVGIVSEAKKASQAGCSTYSGQMS
ncbi:hypothetical protein C5167_017754 [Papaver somniferum]|uniref:RRM domain-containing protein n=1 Tax=Papaver somniferum TaxID=3469 RepID=A0A4Y7IKT9_PAPSO|nr:hypothetical protein C5167_017754 [Papaver somniferum]